jgi:threonine/homoserine/homoserine lactone efflux protein
MLLTEAQLAVVVPMMFLAVISPGPDVLYIVGQAAGSSRRQGIVAVACVAYAGFARIKVRAAARGRWPSYALAAVFGGLAVRLALSERPQ